MPESQSDSQSANSSIQYWQSFGIDLDSDGKIRVPARCTRIKLDVGLSFSAIHAIRWLTDDPELFCIGFEPLKENIELLRTSLSELPNSIDIEERFLIVNLALGDVVGYRPFFVTTDSGQASLLRPKKFEFHETREVRIERLENVLELLPSRFERVDLLKTDCQGTDLEVISGAGTLTNRIAVIVCEAESDSYQNSSNSPSRFVGLLEPQGFIWINRPNLLILILRKVFSQLPSFIRARILTLLEKESTAVLRKSGAPGPKIKTVDPTFINLNYLKEVENGSITALQWN
jgi:FkbM family methyltransferase